MRKSRNLNGDPIFVVKVEPLVSFSTFCCALVDWAECEGSEDIIKNLTKTKAKEILKEQLRWNGMEGKYADGHWEAGGGEWRELLWIEAEKWVSKNYPYLKN